MFGWLGNIFKRLFAWFRSTGSQTAPQAAGYAIGTASSVVLEPLFRQLAYAVNLLYPTVKAGVPELVEAFFRGIIDEEQLRNELAELGYNKFQQDIIVNTRTTLLSVGQIQDLYNRGEISEEEARRRFAEMGFSEREQEELIKLAGYIPTVSDFIRMAVREVFTPEIAQRYGLFEDYPEEFEHYAKMAGLNPQFAKYYWAAHWDLPSATQGFEMYHRGIITYEELKQLLRALDVMPYWRDKLIKLAETPFTRVDVRRMYAAGVLSYEEMVRAYMDLGYSEEKARKLAEWTAKDATEEERDFTKSEIASLYKARAISREKAIELLKEIGYQEDHAELILQLQDYAREKERVSAIKGLLHTLYVKGFLSANDIIVYLGRENLPTEEIEELIRLWDIERELRVALPSKTELERFLQKGIITKEQYMEYLRRHGYPDEVISWYIKDLETPMPKKKGG